MFSEVSIHYRFLDSIVKGKKSLIQKSLPGEKSLTPTAMLDGKKNLHPAFLFILCVTQACLSAKLRYFVCMVLGIGGGGGIPG